MLAVRDLVSPGRAFGLGLRLSAAAAAELGRPERMEELRRFLQSEELFVFTVNAFPFGQFHRGAVKENVYAPDWRTAERRNYTNRVATVLAGLLPEGGVGTISTVPCSWKPSVKTEEDAERIVGHLMECVAHCAGIAEREGREVLLTLEPEPGCFLETTEETVRFFKERLFVEGARMLSGKMGRPVPAAVEMIRHYLGVCLDTCHVALQFEEPLEALRRYEAEGIRVPKIQISSALRTEVGAEGLEALREFVEPVYLHQVKGRTPGGEIVGWRDLPEALAELPSSGAVEARAHFHVPLHFTGSAPLLSTSDLITGEFLSHVGNKQATHLEIETYTWDVLPASVRVGSLEESIAGEFQWLRRQGLGVG